MGGVYRFMGEIRRAINEETLREVAVKRRIILKWIWE
jgi:hypothetical protein